MSKVDKLYVLCFTVLSALGIGYLLTHPTPRPEIAAMTRQVDSLRQAADSAKTVAIQAQYAAKAAGQQERRAADRLMGQLRTTRDSLAALRPLTEDSAATADTLRMALAVAVAMADSLAATATAYLSEVDSLRDRYAEERRAMTVALDKAERLLASQDALIRALETRECRILGRPCPTRTQVFLAGATLGIVLGLAR